MVGCSVVVVVGLSPRNAAVMVSVCSVLFLSLSVPSLSLSHVARQTGSLGQASTKVLSFSFSCSFSSTQEWLTYVCFLPKFSSASCLFLPRREGGDRDSLQTKNRGLTKVTSVPINHPTTYRVIETETESERGVSQ